ncbi:MAG TPA: SGNH/GDSL hydrolase family protein [Gemmatimonadales bacterium]|nr:SGNH/GDSL hydrolase family protein [Gemmatimonadales bacterium]
MSAAPGATAGGRPLRARLPGLALAAVGIAGFAGGVAADRLAGHGTGFGLARAAVVLVGLVLAVAGVELASDAGAERAREWRDALVGPLTKAPARLAAVLGQLVLFALVVRLFQVESPAFYQLLVPLTVFGFVVHHFLPARQRLGFFIALSVVGVVMVLGFTNALWLLALVLAVVSLAHLPVRFWLRVALILAAAVALAVLRAHPQRAPWSIAIWPVLGSILMFRLIVYLYDLRHATGPGDVRFTLAYFLLLPNVVFPLFPVVDFATFRRTYYDQDAVATYQRGLQWILRGLVQLLIYRLIYQYGTIAPTDVVSLGALVRYLLATFGLYLRVSGDFHLVVGMLHLFGFGLPETNHLYYLASSFTDFWRRINIYWKDFMMKVVFYPVYFRLRKRGDTAALVTGTLIVFGITWMTHSYQWFWILGRWLLSWTDGLFWAALGVLLVANSLLEKRAGRRRPPGSASATFRGAALLAARTAGTFTVICLLWSMWGSPTPGDWLDLFRVPTPTPAELALVFGVLLAIGAAAVLADRRERRLGAAGRAASGTLAFGPRAAVTAAGLVVLWLAGSPWATAPLGPGAQRAMREFRFPELSRRDLATMQRGYYENLINVSAQNGELWKLYAERPTEGADIWSAGVLKDRPDFLAKEMRPLFGIYQRGLTFRTNRWGMRDQDYAQDPPPDTYRIALLGQSYVAGDGVSDGETFEALAESRLAREPGRRTHVEILNFAVGSYSLLQQLLIMDRVFSFHPDAVYLVGGPGDPGRARLHLVQQLRRGVPPPWPYLQGLLDRAGVNASMRENAALIRLRPYSDSIVDWTYAQIVAECRQRGVKPVWIYLSLPQPSPDTGVGTAMAAQARAQGFVTLDWEYVYAGHDLKTLQASPWDFHPNAEGHRLIAERFYRDLTEDPELAVPK